MVGQPALACIRGAGQGAHVQNANPGHIELEPFLDRAQVHVCPIARRSRFKKQNAGLSVRYRARIDHTVNFSLIFSKDTLNVLGDDLGWNIFDMFTPVLDDRLSKVLQKALQKVARSALLGLLAIKSTRNERDRRKSMTRMGLATTNRPTVTSGR
jgi:hypothetical protein